MDVELKPLRAGDIEAWADLLAACEKTDRTGEHYDADDLAEEFADPTRDQEQDFVGAWRDDRLVGFASVRVRDQAGATHRIHLEGCTHPDLRGTGIGTTMLQWALDRSAQAHASTFPDVPAEIEGRCLSHDADACGLLEGAGFRPVRWFFTMEADLDGPLPPLEWAAGLELRAYDGIASNDVREAHNAAFQDHWGFAPWSPEMWRQWVDDTRAFRPDRSRVLVDGDGRIVAYVVMYEYEAETTVTGRRTAYVGKVGVLRDRRRQGIASALLARVLEECRQADYPYAALDVDADNPTGALGVYERLGFATTVRWTALTLTLS